MKVGEWINGLGGHFSNAGTIYPLQNHVQLKSIKFEFNTSQRYDAISNQCNENICSRKQMIISIKQQSWRTYLLI